MNQLRSALWSGIIATGPMTLALFAIQSRLGAREKSPLPPATLTKQLTGSSSEDVTLLAHFGYGVATSLMYSCLPSAKRPLASGLGFGLAIWVLSYLGLSPSLGMRARAPNMPAKRNMMMIFAHIIWGAALGSAYSHLRNEGNKMLSGGGKASLAE